MRCANTFLRSSAGSVYCGAEGVPLNIDHVVPRAKGGSNRVSNFGARLRELQPEEGRAVVGGLPSRESRKCSRASAGELKTPLRDAAAVNATRWVLFNELKATGLPVETGSGALTKLNRHAFGVEKEHWLDALCVGRLNGVVTRKGLNVLEIRCMGRGAVNARASRSTASRAGT